MENKKRKGKIPFLLLLKVYVIGQLRINDLKDKNNTKVRKNARVMTILYAILTPVFLGYSYATAYGLVYLGIPEVIPAYALVITALLTIFLTVLKASSILFSFHDYEMLTALPIRTNTMVQSRFFILYSMNLLLALIIMLPMGVAYAIAVKPSWLVGVLWFFGMLLASLIPTTIGTLIGAVIAAISSRFRYSNAFATVLTLLFIGAILVASFLLGGGKNAGITLSDLAALGTLLHETLGRLYPPAHLFSEAIQNGNLAAFVLFVGSSVLWYALFVILLTKSYRAINSRLKGRVARSNYKVENLKQKSVLMALFKKEWKRFLGSTVYLTNTGMGVFMAILFAVACSVMGIEKISELLTIPGFESIFYRLIPFLMAGILSMSCTSSVSLSLEGKNIWILKSLPISVKTILDSKIGMNLSLLLPSAFLIGGMLSIRFANSVVMAFFFFAIPAVYAVFTSVFGMFVNIHFSNYEWESETHVIKQSLPSMIGMLGSPLAAFLPAVLLMLLKTVSATLFYSVVILVLLLVSGLLYRNICNLKTL